MSLWTPYCEPLDLSVRIDVAAMLVHRPHLVPRSIQPAHQNVITTVRRVHENVSPVQLQQAHRNVPLIERQAYQDVPPMQVQPAHQNVITTVRRVHENVSPVQLQQAHRNVPLIVRQAYQDVPPMQVQPTHQYGQRIVQPTYQDVPPLQLQPEYHNMLSREQSAYQDVPPAQVPIPECSTGSSQRSLPLEPITPPESPEDGERKRKPFAIYDNETLSNDAEYLDFEREALKAMAKMNGGLLLGDNPRMRRAVQTSQNADDAYRKQREKNNFAAKQSRNRRRLREIKMSLKIQFLQIKQKQLEQKLASKLCVRCKMPEE